MSKLEDRLVEMTQIEQKKERRNCKNEGSLRDLWDNIKYINVSIVGVPEEKEREQGTYLKT